VLSFEDVKEIIICYPQAKRQAKEKKHSIKKEIEILLIHGLLHLLGYDHQKEKDALKMERLEKRLLKFEIQNLKS
ncbi:MAG: putative rRNA maturation factor, partial [Parcubacteria group bacterium Athens1014_10]